MKGKYKPWKEGGSRQGAQPNQQAKAADSHHRSTNTLQQDKNEARQTDEPGTLPLFFECRYPGVFCHDTRILF
jgi:hypothetical protein